MCPANRVHRLTRPTHCALLRHASSAHDHARGDVLVALAHFFADMLQLLLKACTTLVLFRVHDGFHFQRDGRRSRPRGFRPRKSEPRLERVRRRKRSAQTSPILGQTIATDRCSTVRACRVRPPATGVAAILSCVVTWSHRRASA